MTPMKFVMSVICLKELKQTRSLTGLPVATDSPQMTEGSATSLVPPQSSPFVVRLKMSTISWFVVQRLGRSGIYSTTLVEPTWAVSLISGMP